MYNFCTLFNSQYLSRGLAMYESLFEKCSDFHLYIFSFDDVTFDYLSSLGLEHVTVVSLAQFETPDLRVVKVERTVAEYCWTCTPWVLIHAIDTYGLESCTYLDADLYFFADPRPLIDEMADRSVLITEHRYTPAYDQSASSGIYCVQFMTFRNNPEGRAALNWWADSCLEWCFARFEEGRFGDQKYLDDWRQRFEGVHVLQNLGGGVAPWNIQQYNIFSRNGDVVSAVESASSIEFEIIFYHFHNFKFVQGGFIEFGYYQLADSVKRLIYKPYVEHLLRLESAIRASGYFSIDSVSPLTRNWLWGLRMLKRRILGSMNFHSIEKFLRF